MQANEAFYVLHFAPFQKDLSAITLQSVPQKDNLDWSFAQNEQLIFYTMCDHNKKVKSFCISEQCKHNLSYGCLDCMHRWHKTGFKQKLIQQQELLGMMKIYQVPNQIKEERKKTIYKLYQTLNNIKNEIYDQIDAYFTLILSKVKYPFLFHQNILEAYRLIRDKNFHKLHHQQLLRFYKTTKIIKNQEFLNKQVKYYGEYVQETKESIKRLSSQLQSIQNIFSFSFSKDSHYQHEDLMNQLNAVINQSQNEENNRNDTNYKESKFGTPSKVNRYDISSNYRGHIIDNDLLTPNKPEKILDTSFDRSPSFVSNDDSEGNRHRSNRQNTLLPDLNQRFKILDEVSMKNSKSSNSEDIGLIISNQSAIKQANLSESKHQLLQYSCNQQQNDNMFIKISEVSSQAISTQNNNKISKDADTRSTIQSKQTQPPTFRQSNAKKSFLELLREKQEKLNQKISKKLKTEENNPDPKSINRSHQSLQLGGENGYASKLQAKPSYYLSVINKRKTSYNDSLNDSLDKEVFDFSREEKPKIISRSIKKEIPLLDSPAIKLFSTFQENKSAPIPASPVSDKDRQLQLSAIFYSGINQPVIDNKICFLEKYIEKYELNLTAVEYLSFLYLQKSKFKECYTITSKYLDMVKDVKDDKTKTVLFVNKSAALNNLGRYSETIKLLEQQAKHSDNDKIHKNIADAYHSINVLDKAIYHYQRSIKYNSQFDQAYFNLAVILFKQQSFFNAKMNIEKALRINNSEESYLELRRYVEQRISMNNEDI